MYVCVGGDECMCMCRGGSGESGRESTLTVHVVKVFSDRKVVIRTYNPISNWY